MTEPVDPVAPESRSARHQARPVRRRRPILRYAAALAVVSLVAGVVAMLSRDPVDERASATASSPAVPGAGGTLHLLSERSVARWDPQRLYGGVESALAVRLFTRTLTGYLPPAQGVSQLATDLRPDLATDLGSSTDHRTWRFTIRPDVRWEDDRPVTCEDVRYGISRAFARDQVTGGAPYPILLIDIPLAKSAQGADIPGYAGPYDKTGQSFFDDAVGCSGATLTIRLKVAVPDFPHVVALPVFAPARADRDRGGAGTFDVLSCGPYRLQSPWQPGTGGTFVRNPHWDRSTDLLRRALPDEIEVRESLPVGQLVGRIADQAEDNTTIAISELPVSIYGQLSADEALRSRVTTPSSGNIDFLAPSFKRPPMSNPAVRQAFSMATDRTAYAAAADSALLRPTFSVLAPIVPGHAEVSPFGTPPSGDPAAAAGVLAAAGIATPVPVRVVYRSSPAADAGYAALKVGWERAGFQVQLEPVTDDYYATVSSSQSAGAYDVFRSAWLADYPSASVVLPTLFDGRMNLTETSTGQDVGSFNDDAVNQALEAAAATGDPVARTAAWAQVDQQIARLGGYIALAERRRLLMHGAGVTAYADSVLLGGWPDLAVIGVRR